MIWKLVGVFFGGIVVDLLITRYTRCVALHQPKSAAVLSGLITLGNLAIWGTILQDAENLGVYGAISMALGAAVGTLLGFKQHNAQAEPPAPQPQTEPARVSSISIPVARPASVQVHAQAHAHPHAPVASPHGLAQVG